MSALLNTRIHLYFSDFLVFVLFANLDKVVEGVPGAIRNSVAHRLSTRKTIKNKWVRGFA